MIKSNGPECSKKGFRKKKSMFYFLSKKHFRLNQQIDFGDVRYNISRNDKRVVRLGLVRLGKPKFKSVFGLWWFFLAICFCLGSNQSFIFC